MTPASPSSPDYPHKHGSEGGCADHSVFERMRKFQSSAVEEEPDKVSPRITTEPPFLSAPQQKTPHRWTRMARLKDSTSFILPLTGTYFESSIQT